jgi:predicted dehydrogenase
MKDHHSNTVGVGLFGENGHQIQKTLLEHPQARWLGGAEIGKLPDGVKSYPDLASLLTCPDLDLVSICSPRRDEQGEHILMALESGKHVYAEKPCCMDEATLDRIIETAHRTGCRFHEMASTAFEQPYHTLREIVARGQIGEVVQVLSQKSYPWTDWRPKEEGLDGGLAMQGGIYNLRFVEHVAGVNVKSLQILETTLGNNHAGSDCRRAVSMLMGFANGGVGSAIANYLCPTTWPKWGYEIVRIFGTKGFVDSVDEGRCGTLVLEGRRSQAPGFLLARETLLRLFPGGNPDGEGSDSRQSGKGVESHPLGHPRQDEGTLFAGLSRNRMCRPEGRVIVAMAASVWPPSRSSGPDLYRFSSTRESMTRQAALTSRERVNRVFARQDHDRVPRFETCWGETLDRWMGEGLAAANRDEAMDEVLNRLEADLLSLCWYWPHPFPGRVEILEEDEDTRVTKGPSGTIERSWKTKSGTPEHLGWECTDRDVWDKVFRPAFVNQDIILDAKEVAGKFAAGMEQKGYIYHSDHSVPPQVSWETYTALIGFVDKYGRYT